MMRLRYARNTKDMTEEQFRSWAISRISSLLDIIIVLTFAVACGALIFYLNNRDLQHRRSVADAKFQALVCFALHYTPPDSQFYRDLAELQVTCPAYKPAPGKKSSHHHRKSSPTPSVGAVGPTVPTVPVRSSPVTGPSPSPSARTVTRVHTVNPGHPVTRTRTHTVTHTPSPANPGGVQLCVPPLLCVSLPALVSID